MSKQKKTKKQRQQAAIRAYYAKKSEQERANKPSPSSRSNNAVQLNKKLGNNVNDVKTDTKIQTFNKENLVNVKCKKWRDKSDAHFHVLLGEIDDKNISVGLSTKKFKGKNHPNYPLEKSPFDDGKTSYMRRKGTVASKDSYFSEKNGTMTKKDYDKAKEYGERAKNKYLENKKSNEEPNFPKGHQP